MWYINWAKGFYTHINSEGHNSAQNLGSDPNLCCWNLILFLLPFLPQN